MGIFAIIILWFAVELIIDSGIDKSYKYKKLLIFYHIMCLFLVALFLYQFGNTIYIYLKTKHKKGERGEVGIDGVRGELGVNGKCSSKCGKQSCYILLLEEAEKIFNTLSKENNIQKINNAFFKNKLNVICNSSYYQDVLERNHKNRPSEWRFINYLKGIIKKWVEEIMKYNKYDNMGTKFFKSLSMTDASWDKRTCNNTTPFDEIKKYEIWRWSEKNIVRPIIRRECKRKTDLPEPDTPLLSVVNSNNYEPMYSGRSAPSKWGPDICKNELTGNLVDITGNNNISINWNPDKKMVCRDSCGKTYKTWEKYKRSPSTNNISLYHAKKYIDANGMKGHTEFYPIGSVWSGSGYTDSDSLGHEECTNKASNFGNQIVNTLTELSKGIIDPVKIVNLSNQSKNVTAGCKDNILYSKANKLFKKIANKCTPASSNKCASQNQPTLLGPIKETVLVSGDVKSPVGWNHIWSSAPRTNEGGCKNCQLAQNHVSIWEPIAPEGYVCLGDVVQKGYGPSGDFKGDIPTDTAIRCVPKKCVEKVNSKQKYLWSPDGLKEEIWTGTGLNTPKIQKTYKPKPVSLWSSGTNFPNINGVKVNLDKLSENRPDIQLKEDGGYNLFRSNKTKFKPDGARSDIYRIKDKCIVGKGAICDESNNYCIPKSWRDKNNKSNLASLEIYGIPKRNNIYSLAKYYGFTPLGIITNNNKDNLRDKSKRYYVKHVPLKSNLELKQGEKPNINEYTIQAFNFDSGTFSDCISASESSNLTDRVPDTNLTPNSNHLIWIVEFVKDNGVIKKAPSIEEGSYESPDKLPLVKLKNKLTGKYFAQTYNNNGTLKEGQTENITNIGNHIWKFKSIIGEWDFK